MMRLLIQCFSASLLWLCTCGAYAAEINVKAKNLVNLGPNIPAEMTTIRVTGLFRQGDADAMRRTLSLLKAKSEASPNSPPVTVELSSLGGDMIEGLRMGYLFRDFDVATVVRKHDICLSACALAFLGGTSAHGPSERSLDQSLEIGGRLGFHSFYLNPDSAQSPTANEPAQSRRQGFAEARAGAMSVMRYAADLGIDPKFVASMLGKPQEEFSYVNTAEEFITLNVCPMSLGRPSISPAEQALNICNHSTGWIDPADPSQVRAMTPQQAKRYMLENVQQNMLSLKVKGALSNQLGSYPVMRDEQAIDNLYADLRAAGVRLPEIVGPVFEVSGYRSGSGQMQCFVSLSLDDPNRYEVAIRRPTKWAHPNWSAPKDCRGLFRYDKEAVLNPRS